MLFRGTAGRAGAGLRLQDRQAALGNDDRGPEARRVDAGGPDRLERPRLHRQCGRRQQGRERAHVCARREDRQDRLGILSGAQSSRAIRPADRKARRRSTPSTWRNAPGTPITGGATWTSYTLDPTTGQLVRPRRQSGARFRDAARARARISTTGSVVVLDAKTGAYKRHFKLVPKDWHDWDVSNAPALIETRGGKQLMSVAPKDGHLYGFDLATNALLYRMPVTRIENADATFSTDKAVAFLPGPGRRRRMERPCLRSADQSDPHRRGRLVHHGDAADRCSRFEAVKLGQPWSGMATINPYNIWGTHGPVSDTGRAGSTPSTPTPAPGSGGRSPTTRSRAA